MGPPRPSRTYVTAMLYFPVRSRMLVPDESRPALISVMQGTLRAFSFKSMLNTPEARGSTARIAEGQISATSGSLTVFAKGATEETTPGCDPEPNEEIR